jgi:DmsE family decaheme c-type cytochrome
MTVNQTCYNCHADKRGPLLFEHEPVRELCMNCHTPHGSNEVRLLKQRVPFLCYGCHTAAGGPPAQQSAQLTLGQNLTLNNIHLGGNSYAGRGCMDCHVQIHGSNSPNGAALIR